MIVAQSTCTRVGSAAVNRTRFAAVLLAELPFVAPYAQAAIHYANLHLAAMLFAELPFVGTDARAAIHYANLLLLPSALRFPIPQQRYPVLFRRQEYTHAAVNVVLHTLLAATVGYDHFSINHTL